MEEEIRNWLDMADYDLKTANHLQDSGRYPYVVFMCHLALEKILKAIVCTESEKVPPKTHDLISLIELGKVELSSEHLDFIGKINNVNVVIRYPEDFSSLVESYTKSVSNEYLDKTGEIVRCLKRDERLKK